MYEIALFPSSGLDSENDHRSHKKDGKQKNASGNNLKVIGLFGLLIGAAGVIAGVIFYTTNESISACTYFVNDPTVSFIEKQICESFDCPFDISSCSQQCPFQYNFGPDDCPQGCTCADEAKRYQGDVTFGSEELPLMLQERGMLDDAGEGFSVRAFAINNIAIWTENPVGDRFEIPYEFYRDPGKEYEDVIESHLNHLSRYVCLDFVRKTTEKQFLRFVSENRERCRASIGRNQGDPFVYISHPYCTTYDFPLHVVMHALGFQHEVNRPDRDDYIKVHYENLIPNYDALFVKLEKGYLRDLGLSFDYTSVLLNSFISYSQEPRVRGKQIITRLDTGLPLSDNFYLSELDVEHIRRFYGCTGDFPSIDTSQLVVYDWGQWDEWSACEYCIGGKTTRKRDCVGASAPHCYNAHPLDPVVQTKICESTEECISRIAWNEWGPWLSCATGRNRLRVTSRYRSCIGGSADHKCPGENKQKHVCNMEDYKRDNWIHGRQRQPLNVWLDWYSWTFCNGACSLYRVDFRMRYCHPKGSKECNGSKDSTEEQYFLCLKLPHCKNIGVWIGDGSQQWTRCSVTCGRGYESRRRICNGDNCPGENIDKRPCGFPDCKTPEKVVEWEDWSPWTGCDQSCDSVGTATRTRSCKGGTVKECEVAKKGASEQSRNCEVLPCIHAEWNEWQQWGQCSQTCGSGWKIRERICSERNKCEGLALGFEPCNTGNCAPIPEWSQWSLILPCHRTCGLAIRIYRRTCNPPPQQCDGRAFNVLVCKVDPCPTASEGDDDMLDDETAFSVFSISKFTSVGDLCNSGSPDSWAFGDFNGDKISDAACGKDSGNFTFALSGASQFIESGAWQGEMQDCKGEIKLSADFNGDGSDDLLCQDKKGSLLSVKLSNNGNFNAQATYSSKFCTEENDVVIFADVNNDKKMDVVCHHEDSGEVELFIM